MNDQASSLRKIVKSGQDDLKGRSDMTGKNSMRVVAVSSGKGGVGKTNVVAGLALSLARSGKKVLIIDADLGLANIDILFNIRPELNISDVMSGEAELKDIIVDIQENIKLIPAGSGISDLTRLSEAQKLSLINEFDTIDEDIDYVLVDTGAGISDNVLYFNLASDDCIIVTTTEPTAITDAYALMKVMSGEHGYKYFKLVVNMVKSEKDAKRVYLSLSQAASKFLGGAVIEYLGFLPSEPAVSESVMKRMPVMNANPDLPYTASMQKIARILTRSVSKNSDSGNLKLFMNRFISKKTASG
ncbi:MAG: MinD/ParA family protein [Thermodesulfobacteriota bacterium]